MLQNFRLKKFDAALLPLKMRQICQVIVVLNRIANFNTITSSNKNINKMSGPETNLKTRE